MNAEFYVNIFREHLPEVKKMLGNRWRFQQDNDPKHTSCLAKEFLVKNVLQVMDWPSNSPDLNPIENLWSIIKSKVEVRMSKNQAELKRFMLEEWGKIQNSTLNNLVDSIRERCKLVIEKEGKHIPY